MTGDLQSAIRSMTKYPVACVVAIISLAAGIGCTTATLTLRNAVFFSAPPLFRNPDELTRVRMTRSQNPRPARVLPAVFNAWMEDSSMYSGIADFTSGRRNVRISDSVKTLSVQMTSPSFFSVTGVQPSLGRAFDSVTDASVVLTYGLWQREFNGSLDVLGKQIWVGNQSYTVVGVMPQRHAAWDGQLLIPLDVSVLGPEERIDVLVRRRPNVPPSAIAETFQKELSAIDRDAHIYVSTVQGTPLGEQIAPEVVCRGVGSAHTSHRVHERGALDDRPMDHSSTGNRYSRIPRSHPKALDQIALDRVANACKYRRRSWRWRNLGIPWDPPPARPAGFLFITFRSTPEFLLRSSP